MPARPPFSPPLLSDLVGEPTTRRSFLARTAAAGALLTTACDVERTAQESGSDTLSMTTFNSSSRNDTALSIDHLMPSLRLDAAAAAGYRTYDARLPPLSEERRLEVHWTSNEVPVRILPDQVIAGWTFEGDIPGPVLHVRQGDTVEFTLTNEGEVPHSMDFHAAQIDPRQAFRSVAKGQSVSFTFQPRVAGAFMYHCGTAPVLMHIGSGMYGAIIVSPPEPLPEAREFVLVQSEYYLGRAVDGEAQPLDFGKMMGTMPDYVCFNGRPNQYMGDPLRVKVGERVRFYVVAAGPTHDCRFHVVGEQFDKVYLGAPPGSFIEGVQTYSVPGGGGMIFELLADVPGEFPFVNHGFGHGQKGAMGFLMVDP